MVAVFRPGSLSSGRNTDIPGTGRTAARAVRAGLSNHPVAHPLCVIAGHVIVLGQDLVGGGAGPS